MQETLHIDSGVSSHLAPGLWHESIVDQIVQAQPANRNPIINVAFHCIRRQPHSLYAALEELGGGASKQNTAHLCLSIVIPTMTATTITEARGIVAPYDSDVYNTVNHTLRIACQKAEERNIQPVINTAIREVFLKHNVEKNYSACLIHRHYDLAADERNVEQDGKAVASKDYTGLYPSSWIFHKGTCYPYEYKRYAVPQPSAEFVADLGDLLEEKGLTDLVGFQTYTDGIVGLESTDRETNVSTTIDQDEKLPVPEGMAPASWAFFRV
ncbi:hypothetical protein V495_02002 [Pseudogymnoascus sp. VKM F-4514 (FW-929)]|nr:hypothetical protein V495_02002 [Pseudogymnoascus sp. VKM F-4514 (FW-929)]KFY56092.1 hypothetical protein V497_06541 [Pseudogymnoascus sp. VKM F-4516 (FW-969)]